MEDKKKRILLINHYAGSQDMGMEFRPYYFAREWVKNGYHVDIIAADYSHLRINNPQIQKDFEEQIIDGIHYHWVHTKTYDGNGVKRALSMFQFVGKLWLHAKAIAKEMKPDVIITSSTYPLDTYAGQRIKKYAEGITLIHEIHDMWPISPMELGHMSKYNPFIVAMQMGENSFCKKSDKIVSLLPYAKDYLIQHGMKEEKFFHIANGIVIEDWKQKGDLPEEHETLLNQLKLEGRTIIGFFGSHTKSYALQYLIDAVKQMPNENICAVFVGNGIDKDSLMEYAATTAQVYFLPPVKKNCIPALLEKFDILYVGAVNNRMLRFGICMNKLFDSMMSGKPILYAVNAPNNYIEDYHCGVSVAPEDVEALKLGIRKLLNMSKEQLSEMGQNGQKAVLENFENGVLAGRFLKVMGFE